MKIKYLLLLLSLIANFSFAQNNIKVTRNYGSSSKDVSALLSFESIYLEQLNFHGKELKNKLYTINIQEFTNGKLTNKSVLFEGSGQEVNILK